MIKCKTENGFEIEVNENIAKDFRIVMATARVNSSDVKDKVVATYDYVAAIVGKVGLEKLIEFAIEKCGYADTEFIVHEAKEILACAAEIDDGVKK